MRADSTGLEVVGLSTSQHGRRPEVRTAWAAKAARVAGGEGGVGGEGGGGGGCGEDGGGGEGGGGGEEPAGDWGATASSVRPISLIAGEMCVHCPARGLYPAGRVNISLRIGCVVSDQCRDNRPAS